MVFSAIQNGLRLSWKSRKILLLFCSFNLLTAVFFLRPYFTAFNTFFSKRLVTYILAQDNIYTYYSEFYHYMKYAVLASSQVIFIGGLLHFFISIILSGGLIYYFLCDEAVNLRTFFSQSGRFAGRMLRLVILSVVIFAAFLFACLLLFLPLKLIIPSGSAENIYFFVYAAWITLSVNVLLVALLLIDLTRIHIVEHESKSVVISFFESLNLFTRHYWEFTFAFIIIFIIGLVVFILFWWLQDFITDTNVCGIIAGFILLQLFVFAQYWVKFSRFGALVNITKQTDL